MRQVCGSMPPKGLEVRALRGDVYEGLAEEARALVQTLLKSLLGQREGWQRRKLEANVWQDISFGVMRSVGRQLVWSTRGSLDDAETWSHQPYN